jgi:hypothetical protein
MLAGLFEPVYRRTFTDTVCAWQFGEVLGNTRRNGKTVYKAYDTNEGIEVATSHCSNWQAGFTLPWVRRRETH